MAPSYVESNSASMQILEEKAKQDAWNSLPEEQRQRFCYEAASRLPITTTQMCMLNQIPRTMPSNIDMMHFSVWRTFWCAIPFINNCLAIRLQRHGPHHICPFNGLLRYS